MRFAPGKISVVAVLLAAVAAPQAATPSKIPRPCAKSVLADHAGRRRYYAGVPAGSFVAAELRRVPPINLGGKGQSTRAVVPPMKPTPTSSNGQTELYKWNFAAGEEMQLDILFAPSLSKNKNPGP